MYNFYGLFYPPEHEKLWTLLGYRLSIIILSLSIDYYQYLYGEHSIIVSAEAMSLVFRVHLFIVLSARILDLLYEIHHFKPLNQAST